ncbi:MAG: hypothetical protein IJT36_04790 [Alphaproteobacteria bacterium]|nr:hypothetical protein [Alphaproteobacteria bacterium]
MRYCDKKYKTKKTSDAGLIYIPNCIDISEHLGIIEDKTCVGDWENDTVISYGNYCALPTLVDRRSKCVTI